MTIMGDAIRAEGAPWLLLLYQLPPKPAYLRVKIWRRLQALGAIAIRGSAYALPDRGRAREDLQWLCEEIAAAGGEPALCETRLLAGLDDAQLHAQFRDARAAAYDALRADVAALLEASRRQDGPPPDARTRRARLRRRFDDIVAQDFFASSARVPCADMLARLEAALRPKHETNPTIPPVGDRRPRGAVWVTRADVHIDRIASAWLIRRFVDPGARFRFVAEGEAPRPGEIRFDMWQAEFTHEGDRCTFEVLCARFAPADAALAAIGEIVHDIDLKDERHGRPETAGIARLVDGLALDVAEDAERLIRSAALFDGLYAALRTDSEGRLVR